MKKIHLLIFIFSIVFFAATAQKLPKIQEKSLWAPKDIKIDGQADEWGDFQAYNKSTGVFYKLANDSKNLYLVVKGIDQAIVQKLTIGGVSLILAPSKKELKKHGIALKYGFYDKTGNMHNIKMDKRLTIVRTITKDPNRADSLRKSLNDKLLDAEKTVEIYGAKNSQDTLTRAIEGKFKATLRFDEKLNCVYELAVPLNVLKGILNKLDTFSYQLELTGAANGPGTSITLSGLGKYIIITVDGSRPHGWPNVPKYADLIYPTNFIAEYTLAKK